MLISKNLTGEFNKKMKLLRQKSFISFNEDLYEGILNGTAKTDNNDVILKEYEKRFPNETAAVKQRINKPNLPPVVTPTTPPPTNPSVPKAGGAGLGKWGKVGLGAAAAATVGIIGYNALKNKNSSKPEDTGGGSSY